jgi:hypothetical protein
MAIDSLANIGVEFRASNSHWTSPERENESRLAYPAGYRNS